MQSICNLVIWDIHSESIPSTANARNMWSGAFSPPYHDLVGGLDTTQVNKTHPDGPVNG